MSPITLIDLAHDVSIRFGVDGSDRVLEAPAEPPAQLLALLQHFKPAIIEYLAAADGSEEWGTEDWRAFVDERAGVGEFDGGTTRTEAEAQAYRCAVAKWLKRHPVRSEAGCCLSCGGIDRQGALVVPIGCPALGHVWLHPECWPTWHVRRVAQAEAKLAQLGISPPLDPPPPSSPQKMGGQP